MTIYGWFRSHSRDGDHSFNASLASCNMFHWPPSIHFFRSLFFVVVVVAVSCVWLIRVSQFDDVNSMREQNHCVQLSERNEVTLNKSTFASIRIQWANLCQRVKELFALWINAFRFFISDLICGDRDRVVRCTRLEHLWKRFSFVLLSFYFVFSVHFLGPFNAHAHSNDLRILLKRGLESISVELLKCIHWFHFLKRFFLVLCM